MRSVMNCVADDRPQACSLPLAVLIHASTLPRLVSPAAYFGVIPAAFHGVDEVLAICSALEISLFIAKQLDGFLEDASCIGIERDVRLRARRRTAPADRAIAVRVAPVARTWAL